jgi:hypothetical protein
MAVVRMRVALFLGALALFAMTGCADLTRPDGAPRPDPAAKARTAAAGPAAGAPVAAKLAALAPSPLAAANGLDVVPLDPAPGRLHDVVPTSANPAPAAAAGGGGG